MSVMQAVNISTELKLAGALSQSVWACAESTAVLHCEKRARQREEFDSVVLILCNILVATPCVRQHLEGG